ncbi:hypothetical protein Dimus_039681 [Dionaea muscipula]
MTDCCHWVLLKFDFFLFRFGCSTMVTGGSSAVGGEGRRSWSVDGGGVGRRFGWLSWLGFRWRSGGVGLDRLWWSAIREAAAGGVRLAVESRWSDCRVCVCVWLVAGELPSSSERLLA